MVADGLLSSPVALLQESVFMIAPQENY